MGLLIFIGISVVGLGGLYALRDRLIGPPLAAWLERRIESELGLTVSIERIGGTYFGHIAIINLATTHPAVYGPLARLDLKNLRADYSLLALLGGVDRFLASILIEVQRADLTLDWRLPPRTTLTGGPNRPTRLPSGIPLPAHLPQIRIAQSSLTLLAGGMSSKFEDIGLHLQQVHGGPALLELRAGVWRWDIPNISSGAAPVRLKIAYQRDLALTVDPLVIGRNDLTLSAKFGLEALPRLLPFTIQSRMAGAPLDLSGRIRAESIEARFQADTIDLGAISKVAAFLEPGIQGTLAFGGDLEMPWENPGRFNGSLTLDLRDGRYRNVAADRLKLAASAISGTIAIDQLDVTGAKNRVSAQQVTLPPALWADAANPVWFAALGGRFNLVLQDIPALLDMFGLRYERPLTELPPHVLTLAGSVVKGGNVAAEGNLAVGENNVRLAPSRATISFPEGRLDSTAMDIRLKADLKDLGLLARLFPVPDMAGNLNAEFTIDGSLARPRGRAVLNGTELAVNRVTVGTLDASLTAGGNKIVAERLVIANGQDRVEIRGDYNIDRQVLANVLLTLKIAEVKPYLALWTDPAQRLRGDLQGSVRASGPLKTPQVQVQARSQTFEIDGLVLSRIRIQAAHTDGQVHAENVEVSAFGGLLKTGGSLLYGANFKTIEADLNELFISRKNADLRLLKPARIRFATPGLLQISELRLAGQMGEIRLSGTLSQEGVSDLSLQLEGLTSEGWLAEFLGRDIEFEGMNARGRMQGIISAPSIAFAGSVATVRSPHFPVPLSGRFDLSYTDGNLRIAQFDWSGKGGYRASADGVLPLPCVGRTELPAGRLSLAAAVQFPDARAVNLFFKNERVSAGTISAALKLTGTWLAPAGDLDFEVRDVVPARQWTGLPPGPLQMAGDVRYRNDRLSIDRITLDSPALSVSGQGSWTDGLTPAMLCHPPADKLPGEIAFDGKLTVSELAWLGSHFAQIRRIDGRLDADLSLRGPIAKPAVTAAVVLKDGEVRLQAEVPSLQAIEMNALLTPEKIEIRNLQGLLGGSAVYLQGRLSAPLTENPIVDATLKGENLLLYRDQGLRLRADTDLVLQGPLNQMVLAGEVRVTDGLFDRYIDWLGGFQGSRGPQSGEGMGLFSIPDPPLRDLRLDVQIKSKAPFRIRSNLVKGRLRPELHLSGTGEVPVLMGKILVDATGLRLPSGTLVFENGLVRFLESDPDRPVLDLIGSARMLGYDITVLVNGPYNDPVVTLSSAPPLPNEDLLLLVLTGTPPSKEGQAFDQKKSSLNVAVYIGRDLLERWFKNENGESTESILDRFEADVGRDITQKGEETLEARFRLLKNIFRQKDTLYITGEKDVYDYYNAGVRIVFRFQ